MNIGCRPCFYLEFSSGLFPSLRQNDQLNLRLFVPYVFHKWGVIPVLKWSSAMEAKKYLFIILVKG